MIRAFDAMESVLVTVVAKLAPWLAPLPTAWLVYAKTTEYIGWPAWVGILAAVPLEALGLVTAKAAVDLYGYNRAKLKSEPVAPLWLALVLVGAYFLAAELLTLGLHVAPILEAGQRGSLADWVLVVFPVLSLVAMAAIALRVDQAQREADNAEAARRRKEERKSAQAAPQPAAEPAQDTQPAQILAGRRAKKAEAMQIIAGLNGKRAELDEALLQEELRLAGFADSPESTLRSWIKSAHNTSRKDKSAQEVTHA